MAARALLMCVVVVGIFAGGTILGRELGQRFCEVAGALNPQAACLVEFRP